MTVYIAPRDIQFWLVRVAMLLLVILLERVMGIPVLSLFVALFLAQGMSSTQRFVWLILGGMGLAILFLLPFWLVVGVLLVLEFGLETITMDWMQREVTLGVATLLGAAVLLLFTQQVNYGWNILQLLLLIALVLVLQRFQLRVGRGLTTSSLLQWYEQHRD